MVKADRMRQLAFGNHAMLRHLLLTAEEDVRSACKTLDQFESMNDEALFRLMHNLKSTLIMLEAGDVIPDCQFILTSIEKNSTAVLSNKIPLLRDKLKMVEKAIIEVRENI